MSRPKRHRLLIAMVALKLAFAGLVVLRVLSWRPAEDGQPVAASPTIVDHGLNVGIGAVAIAAIVLGFAAFREITRRG
ncbi:MAG: hypothetical protein AB8G96_16495 [Phycisphaerales bacterium]